MQKGRLPRLKEKAITCLLTSDTLEESAQAVGVTSRTLRAWLQQPEFAQAYKEARLQVLSDSIKKLQGVTGAAVETLHHSLLNAKSDSARIQAAKTILDYSLKGYVLETITADIEEIKQTLEGRNYYG
jgi:arginine/lysine/ornithine decarboxylase